MAEGQINSDIVQLKSLSDSIWNGHGHYLDQLIKCKMNSIPETELFLNETIVHKTYENEATQSY